MLQHLGANKPAYEIDPTRPVVLIVESAFSLDTV